MKTLLSLALTFISFFSFCQELIIKDVTLLPMTSKKTLKNQSVLIKNGIIKKIGGFASLRKSKKTQIIDGKNKYLMPGLADMHSHFPELDGVDEFVEKSVKAGITQMRVMDSKNSIVEIKKALKKTKTNLPNIHYSYKITKNDFYTKVQWDSIFKSLKNKDVFVKLFSIPNQATFENIMDAANKHKITVCGHYPFYKKKDSIIFIDSEKVLKSNFKSIEHLSGYNSNNLNKAIKLTKKNKVYNCPTLDGLIISYNLLYPNNFKNRLTYKLVSDAQIETWKKELHQKNKIQGGKKMVKKAIKKNEALFKFKTKLLKQLYKHNCKLLIGSDSGNPYQGKGINIYEEMKNWSNIGIDNYTILKSATVTPSYFFNQQKKWGTIEVGKDADLILLSDNPLNNIDNITTVEMTIVKGKVYD